MLIPLKYFIFQYQETLLQSGLTLKSTTYFDAKYTDYINLG